jgi:HlyD family secretion protein
MKKKLIIGGVTAIVLIVVLWIIFKPGTKSVDTVLTKVKKGDFFVNVTTTGELEAQSSENITGPVGIRNVGIWQVKITDLVAEGTVVDSGDYVATLDRTEISTKMKDLESELQKYESQFTKTQLDTTLEMRNARDELVNLKYAMEEKQITLDQSKYEPPATIRQAEIDLDKAKRTYEQAVKNYKLKYEQSVAKMQEVNASLSQAKRKFDDMLDVIKQFTVNAPKSGMVIYKRDWEGKKVAVGSTINPWDNVVATLPDLSVMMTKTYVNEIDISKIKTGQVVNIGVDAFPDKKYTGTVKEVANIGEQLPNNDSKVFEVKIKVNEHDTIMRPAMTTKNVIRTATIKNVLSVPIECVHNDGKSTYVYKANGYNTAKQQVKVGISNDTDIIIEKGLEENDEIYVNAPDKLKDLKLIPLN